MNERGGIAMSPDAAGVCSVRWSRLGRGHHGDRRRTGLRRPGPAKALPRRLRRRRGAGAARTGCLDFAITAYLIDPGRINTFERWETQEAVKTFRGSGPSEEQSAATLAASVAEYDSRMSAHSPDAFRQKVWH
jgi:heme-degrading monooxygenase HmoA